MVLIKILHTFVFGIGKYFDCNAEWMSTVKKKGGRMKGYDEHVNHNPSVKADQNSARN